MERVEEGPLFINEEGMRAKIRDFNATFQEFVGMVMEMERSPDAFLSKIEELWKASICGALLEAGVNNSSAQQQDTGVYYQHGEQMKEEGGG